MNPERFGRFGNVSGDLFTYLLIYLLGFFRWDYKYDYCCIFILKHYEYEIGVRVRFVIFKLVMFPEPSLFMLVLGRKGSSWNEMGLWKACKLD